MTAHNQDLSRVMMTAGGTGGHIFPGVAVARQLIAKGVAVRWVGTEYGLEKDIVPKEGIPIHYLSVKGLRGKGKLRLLTAPYMLIKSFYQAIRLIRQTQPQVVLSLGGYASGPVAIAAVCCRIPLVIHEQNAAPGLTNRLLAPVSKLILSGFLNNLCRYEHFELVGNPVRDEFNQVESMRANTPHHENTLNILVVGGSQGAQVLNKHMPLALEALADQINTLENESNLAQDFRVNIVHQTGVYQLADTKASYVDAGIKAETVAFIDDMAGAYAWADIVVSRAGALTVSEVAAAGVAAIFIPLAAAVDDHQTKNAQTLVDQGAAVVIPESQISAQKLADYLFDLCLDPQQCQHMGAKALAAARPAATTIICDRLAETYQQSLLPMIESS